MTIDTAHISDTARLLAAIADMKQKDLERLGAMPALCDARERHRGYARACNEIIQLIQREARR